MLKNVKRTLSLLENYQTKFVCSEFMKLRFTFFLIFRMENIISACWFIGLGDQTQVLTHPS